MNERILCKKRTDKKKIYLKIPTIDLVTKALKQKIEADASTLKLLKTKESGVGKLPI